MVHGLRAGIVLWSPPLSSYPHHFLSERSVRPIASTLAAA